MRGRVMTIECSAMILKRDARTLAFSGLSVSSPTVDLRSRRTPPVSKDAVREAAQEWREIALELSWKYCYFVNNTQK